MVQVPGFGIFPKSASRLVPDGWVEIKISGCRCHFRTIQLELDILDTKNIGNGPVVKELQPLKDGNKIENFIILLNKLNFRHLRLTTADVLFGPQNPK